MNHKEALTHARCFVARYYDGLMSSQAVRESLSLIAAKCGRAYVQTRCSVTRNKLDAARDTVKAMRSGIVENGIIVVATVNDFGLIEGKKYQATHVFHKPEWYRIHFEDGFTSFVSKKWFTEV